MNRRHFLRAGGAALLAASLPTALIGCQVPFRGAVSPTPRPAPGDDAWQALARSLRGSLLRPGSAGYDTARLLFNERFDDMRPAAVAECRSVADVQSCLAFARRFAVSFMPRSGGHGYAGYSTSTDLVVSVRGMNSVAVDPSTSSAVVGAGALLIDVYAALARHGLALPAGSCPTVGIAGLTLGGGVGVIGRKYGLTCDNLLSVEAVTTDGRVRTCDLGHDPDLFWALRGAGGGNFAIATAFTFRVHPLRTVSVFTYEWPWAQAAAMLSAWQRWAPQAPDELWSNCLLLATQPQAGGPAARVNGVHVGPMPALLESLQQLIAAVGSPPSSRYASPMGYLDAMQLEAGCYGRTVAQCHLPSEDPQGQIQRQAFGARSDYFTSPLPAAAIQALVAAVARRQADPALADGGVGLDALGGAINRVAPDATAFVHRDALFSTQYSANWTGNHTLAASANTAWLDQVWRAMRPYASGQAYQNYADPSLTDWAGAYYGANLPRLRRVRARYDPYGLFNGPQSISAA